MLMREISLRHSCKSGGRELNQKSCEEYLEIFEFRSLLSVNLVENLKGGLGPTYMWVKSSLKLIPSYAVNYKCMDTKMNTN